MSIQIKPDLIVAVCPGCKINVAAIDVNRTENTEMARMLGELIFKYSATIDCYHGGDHEVQVGSCQCKSESDKMRTQREINHG